MAAVVCIGLSACSSDDDDKDNSPSSIVGTWVHSEDGDTETIEFKKDGTVTDVDSYGSSRDRSTGTYRLNGNKLIINWTKWEEWNSQTNSWEVDEDEEPETVVITIKIEGNKLTLLSMEGEEDYESVVYTRQ